MVQKHAHGPKRAHESQHHQSHMLQHLHTELSLHALKMPSRVLMIDLLQQSELFNKLLSLRWLSFLCMLTSLSILVSKLIIK